MLPKIKCISWTTPVSDRTLVLDKNIKNPIRVYTLRSSDDNLHISVKPAVLYPKYFWVSMHFRTVRVAQVLDG